MIQLLGDPLGKMNVIVHGAQGSGKSSLVNVYRRLMYPEEPQIAKYSIIVDVERVGQKDIYTEMKSFLEKCKNIPEGLSLCVILDNFQCITPQEQQQTRIFIDSFNRKGVKFILMCQPTCECVIKNISENCNSIEMLKLSPLDNLHRVLQICVKNRIGFTRPAIELLMERAETHSTSTIIDTLQKAFTTYHYLSIDNMYKVFGESYTFTIKLSILDMSKPHTRCSICTLFPPCKHVTLQSLYDVVVKQRQRYPRDRGRQICPIFERTGVCPLFNRKKKCSYDHPLDLHQIDTSMLRNRCLPHTLESPCWHCQNIQQMEAGLTDKRLRLESTRQKIEMEKKEAAGLEIDIYIHLKKGAEEPLWGSKKVAYDEETEQMQTRLVELRQSIELCNELVEHSIERIKALEHIVTVGQSKGVGKGNGAI